MSKVREVREQQEETMAYRDKHATLTTAGQAGETTAPFQDRKQAPPEHLSLETRPRPRSQARHTAVISKES